MNRLLLYVHFNKYDTLSEHVIYQLDKLKSIYSRVVFISNSKLAEWDKARLQNGNLVDDILERENIGFDFAAWRDGMDRVGFDNLSEYASVTCMNDTCFGPIWDLEPIYRKFEFDEEVDFWGMTNHRNFNDFPEHLQSYFLSFKQNMITSSVFKEFWKNVEDFTDVNKVIDCYETKLTQIFRQAGFEYGTYFDTLKQDTTHMLHPDFTYYNVASILLNRVPFVKVKGIDGNPLYSSFVIDYIECNSSYPKELIINHMSQYFDPAKSYLLRFKNLASASEQIENKKIAIHLHTFYVDLLQEFLDEFSKFSFPFDLFITTDSDEKLVEINNILLSNNAKAIVQVTGNRGRDILPMLKLKDDLSRYDYIGHFHTKKSKEAEHWAGETWRKELINMLVRPSDSIVANLQKNQELGIVIADIPTYFRFVKLDPWYELSLTPAMTELWKKMKMTKIIDFSQFSTFTMSYGTYCWFKYDALKPLFDLDLKDSDVPEEPLPQDSILHSIERMLIYIAWGQNYDFRIAPNPIYISSFLDVQQLNTRNVEQYTTTVVQDFTNYGGITGALNYLQKSILYTSKYIIKKLLIKMKLMNA